MRVRDAEEGRMSAEIGECNIRAYYDPRIDRDRVNIDRADPVVRFSADLLQQICDMTERGEATWAKKSEHDGQTVVTFNGDNKRVVYVIDSADYDFQQDAYLARWPD